ncbi:GntR family transcriptional regulator [Virgibacillus profundi]|uniref:GntR family transcriptional regulator n=1 Tax=Virgibacillus profundi TaxID=2024555 RepID=A0A2A2IIG2_9BACI|nr:FadR/GntR family transcriptional regulator [Virgibacillus profundi]PAV31054.1 GntR family transcriptional regulator [Virgibacillus profundi]PXY55240.1 FadR family transcriptional regulator [Virgibacillus profundi]
MEPVQVTERNSLKKTAIQEIKKYIIDQQLKAGDKLPTERKFTEMFGVSRSVVREALSYLENTGVVTTTQGKGAFINESNIEILLNSFFFLWQVNDGQIEDVLSLRIIFESSAIDEIIRQNPVNELAEWKQMVVETKSSQTLEAFREADVSFHKHLLKATKNELFIQMTNMITSYFFETEYIEMTIKEYRKATEEHLQIVEAMVNGNAEQAKSLLTRHIQNTKV